MFATIKRIHFVGIGGIGMSGIAEVLFNLGYRISGSDIRRSQITERFASLGVVVYHEHAAEHVAQADVVVYSSAVKLSNPEIAEAKRRGIPVIRRAEMLGELMRMKYGIGVAGTHGKTTTTSMIGATLSQAGLDPTIIVGGRVCGLETNARLGEGEYLVAEADEFDRSFLRMTPTIAVVTTLEAEHLDCYRNLDDIKDAFVEFVNKVPFYGSAVLCLDEASVQSIIPRIEKTLITYGITSQADVRAHEVAFEGLRTRFDVTVRGSRLGSILLPLPGLHNVKNALGTVGVSLELGIDFDTIRKALEGFAGVHRRFEVKGEAAGVTIVDDYAHHPTEIQATLTGARAASTGRIVAVFQPHLFSRTRDFCREFGQSFLNCDMLVVTGIYPAREEPIPGVTGELIVDAACQFGHRDVRYIPDAAQIAEQIVHSLRPDDMVITLGAGDIWKVGEELLRLLKSTGDSNSSTRASASGDNHAPLENSE